MGKSGQSVPALSALEKFEIFYRQLWGDRWTELSQALRRPVALVARPNRFAPGLSKPLSPAEPLPRSEEGLLGFYWMDPASIWAAEALQVRPGDRVLDVCAAPGGKSLLLVEALVEEGEATLNELSAARRERLKKVVQNYVPRKVRDRVWVTGRDGGLFAKSHPGTFDRILLDAPCSGERHLLNSPKDLENWTEKSSAKLAQRQFALLTGAWAALKPGGTLVYSTCSLSPLENDQVIERLQERRGQEVEVLSLAPPKDENFNGERTGRGWFVLPDRGGQGPLYWACLRKRGEG